MTKADRRLVSTGSPFERQAGYSRAVALGPVCEGTGRWFAEIRPAATMIVAGLIRPEMKVEIEATARRAD